MQRDHTYFVYVVASQPQGTLSIGVTNDLRRRVEEHRNGAGGTFTRRDSVAQLVVFEHHGDINTATRNVRIP